MRGRKPIDILIPPPSNYDFNLEVFNHRLQVKTCKLIGICPYFRVRSLSLGIDSMFGAICFNRRGAHRTVVRMRRSTHHRDEGFMQFDMQELFENLDIGENVPARESTRLTPQTSAATSQTGPRLMTYLASGKCSTSPKRNKLLSRACEPNSYEPFSWRARSKAR